MKLIFHCKSSLALDKIHLKSRCLPDVVDLEYCLDLGIFFDDQGKGPVSVVVILLVFSSGLTLF